MSLKLKAINSFSWTLFEMIFNQGSIFLVGIILARILSPQDFGIIGLITAFIAVTNSIIEGGFSSALIRKINVTNTDYNTVFFTNLLVSTTLYLILFFSAEVLSKFFETPILAEILKYSGIILIINATTLVQTSILSRNLNFKTQAIISITASISSGLIAIFMAYRGYGIWSLVILSILRPFLNSTLLWLNNNWRPSLEFSKNSFKELFNYGYKLLMANLINTIYKNIYYVLIGKFFSPISLGYYTRAEQFQSPVSGNITAALRRISFPILSSLQNDNIKLKTTFTRFLRFSIFLNFTIMLGIAAIAQPMVLLLIGEKWSSSIIYLQLLCIPGMLYPLQILHLNLLLIKGYSNLNLKLEIAKKIILIPLIYITVLISIKAMLFGLVVFSLIEYFINSFYTKKFLDYSIKDQMKDIFPFLIISLLTASSMFIVTLFDLNNFFMLLIQLAVGSFIFIITNEIMNVNEYIEIKKVISNIIKKSLFK
ncbi:hypothetical protein SB49_02410 [Sediminicola sp. YIK13]|uniref:lipopolysaccharide biosynthesis protein n=1 Tax=Sediminicola sp. YIK13 TaxID=1453352 RepID=UPI000721351A|nr:lipopolysaccharide biosynthesis protein [Sediminicola sp. YIK13]ALM06783.1 hypothetical protein SB49_02410 [Sediminicola sp. YIK13]